MLQNCFNRQNDVIGCAQQVEALESQFAARMEALKNTVQSKTAVPTAQVYVSKMKLIVHGEVSKTVTNTDLNSLC